MLKNKKFKILAGLLILLASSSLPAVSLTPMVDTLGEDFSSNFGLVFDLNAQGDPSSSTISTNVQVMQDLGSNTNPLVNPVDQNPWYDQQFFFSHYNVSGVSNIFLALEKMEFNITFNVLGNTFNVGHVNGSAPFQSLLQYFHFNDKNVLVANTFRGLVAYTTSPNNETLDNTDQSYFGYSFVESHFLDLLNGALTGHGFSAIPQYGFTPIYDPSTHTFGMNYTNYFVVWQATPSSAPSALSAVAGNAFDNVATGSNIVAASLFKYLSFTYKVEEDTAASTATSTVVKVTANYDLGPMEWLITKDDATTLGNIQASSSGSIDSSNSFNMGASNIQFNVGSSYAVVVPVPSLSFYTGAAVQTRIDASAMQTNGVSGMGISVVTSTNAIVLGSTVNAADEKTNSQDINIPLSFGSDTFFKTDFAGKSTYTRTFANGTADPTHYPVYVSTRNYANLGDLIDTSSLASAYFGLQTIQTIGTAIYSLVQLNSGFTSADHTNLKVDHTSYVTFVEMPKWSGLQVTQDPSFSAVSAVSPSSSSGTGSTSSSANTVSPSAPGFEMYLFMVAVVPLYILKKRKNNI